MVTSVWNCKQKSKSLFLCRQLWAKQTGRKENKLLVLFKKNVCYYVTAILFFYVNGLDVDLISKELFYNSFCIILCMRLLLLHNFVQE